MVRITESTDSVGDTPVEVSGVTLRAQHVVVGDLFAALPGARTHGAEHAAAALDAGARAVVTDEEGARTAALTEHASVAGGEVPLLVHPEPRRVLGALAAEIYGRPSRRLSVLASRVPRARPPRVTWPRPRCAGRVASPG